MVIYPAEERKDDSSLKRFVNVDPFPTSPTDLIWTRSREAKRSYVLGDGGKTFATLSFPSALSNRAVGEWSRGRMIVEKHGILHDQVTIAGEAFGDEIARMPWTWRKESRIDFANGRSYQMKKHGFWNNYWTISKEDGTIVMELRVGSAWREQASLRIEHGDRLHSDLPYLAILLWYSYRIGSQESAAAASMAAGA